MRHDQKMGNGKVLSFMKLFLMANRGSGTTTKHGLNTAFLLCLPQAKIVIPTQLTPLSYSCSEINQAGPLYWKKIPALFPQTILFGENIWPILAQVPLWSQFQLSMKTIRRLDWILDLDQILIITVCSFVVALYGFKLKSDLLIQQVVSYDLRVIVYCTSYNLLITYELRVTVYFTI